MDWTCWVRVGYGRVDVQILHDSDVLESLSNVSIFYYLQTKYAISPSWELMWLFWCWKADFLYVILSQGSLDGSKTESLVKSLQTEGRYLRDVWWDTANHVTHFISITKLVQEMWNLPSQKVPRDYSLDLPMRIFVHLLYPITRLICWGNK